MNSLAEEIAQLPEATTRELRDLIVHWDSTPPSISPEAASRIAAYKCRN